MPISEVFREDVGIGGVIGLYGFGRLPQYASLFGEMILMVTADHGPAVSGAHNTIVTARAGKDLISSLVRDAHNWPTLVVLWTRRPGSLPLHMMRIVTAGLCFKMRKEKKLIMGVGTSKKSAKSGQACDNHQELCTAAFSLEQRAELCARG